VPSWERVLRSVAPWEGAALGSVADRDAPALAGRSVVGVRRARCARARGPAQRQREHDREPRNARRPRSATRRSCSRRDEPPPPPRTRLRVKRAGRCGPAYPAAAAVTGVPCDLLGPRRRAAREEERDLACELALEVEVFACAPLTLALSPSAPRVLIGQALGLRPLDRSLLDKHTLVTSRSSERGGDDRLPRTPYGANRPGARLGALRGRES
jgi:hypothetical protein